MSENEFENIANLALIIITPEGDVHFVKDKGQKRHKELFSTINDHNIKNFIEEAFFGFQCGSLLSQKGYISFMGQVSTSKVSDDYYKKKLYVPKEPNEAQKKILKELLNNLYRICDNVKPNIEPTLTILKDGKRPSDEITIPRNGFNEESVAKMVLGEFPKKAEGR